MQYDIPRFLLSMNKAALNKAAFIIHTKEPFVIVEIINKHQSIEDELIKVSNEKTSLVVRKIDSSKVISSSRLNGLLNRMLDWYSHLPPD